MSIMTPKQAFNYSMNTYPLLYVSDSYYESLMRIYDQIFNTIGNGINEYRDFIDMYTINEKNEKSLNGFPTKYIDSEPLYTVIFNDGDRLNEMLTLEEANSIVNKSTIRISRMKPRKPSLYPNFKERYSMIYQVGMHRLPIEWLVEAKWYYEQANKFFNSDRMYDYHDSVPRADDDKEWERVLGNFNNILKRYKKEHPDMDSDELYNIITDEYGIPFDGDLKGFLLRKWDKEHKRILRFIHETIERLDDAIKQNKT